MQIETLDEVISVRADFSGGELTPRVFRRGGETHRVTEVNARWVDRTSDMLWRVEWVVLEG